LYGKTSGTSSAFKQTLFVTSSALEETENGIEEEAACFSGIYITAIVRRFHCGPL
jgi:hypothetical protein